MGSGKVNKDPQIILLMENIRNALRERQEISKHLIKHYASLSNQKMWDKNFLPEICTLYAGYIQLDIFLDRKILFLQSTEDNNLRKLTKEDLNFIAEQTTSLHRIEDFLASRNLCLYYI
jgi:hypothetical protein